MHVDQLPPDGGEKIKEQKNRMIEIERMIEIRKISIELRLDGDTLEDKRSKMLKLI